MTLASPSRHSTPNPSACVSADSLQTPSDACQPRNFPASLSLLAECAAGARAWKFEVAFEGGARLSGVAASPGIRGQIIAYVRITVGVLVGSALGIFGFILSVIVLSVSYIFPSLRAKVPQRKNVRPKTALVKPRGTTSPQNSIHSTTPAPIPVPQSQPVESCSSNATVSSFAPERRVTFQLTPNWTGSSDGSSVMCTWSNKSPTLLQFADGLMMSADPELEEDGSTTSSRRDSVATTSTSASSSSRGFVRRFIKRRGAASSSEPACASDVEFMTASPATSTPASPSGTTYDLPASNSEIPQHRPKVSLRVQLRAFKRRSPTPTSPLVGFIRSGPLAEFSLPTPPPSSKHTKRFSLPHIASAATSYPNRTDPYNAPDFASISAAMPKDRNKRASYHSRGAPSSSLLRERRANLDGTTNFPSSPTTMIIRLSVTSDSVASSKRSKRRTNSKPPVVSTSPRVIDRHARMQEVAAAAYSDSEVALSWPARSRSRGRM